MPRKPNFGSPARTVKRTLAAISVKPADYTVTALHVDPVSLRRTFFVDVRAEYGVWSLLVSEKRDFGHGFDNGTTYETSVHFRTGSIFNSGPSISFEAPRKVATLAKKAALGANIGRDFDEREPGRVWDRKPITALPSACVNA